MKAWVRFHGGNPELTSSAAAPVRREGKELEGLGVGRLALALRSGQ